MRYFSAFTGVGGFEMGLPKDWQCVGMSEIDKYANMVLKYHFKEVKNYGDITKINYEEIPDFEMLVGGSPCQDISVAGQRTGLDGIRSRLFFSYTEILKAKKPGYFIFENVKGLLSSQRGWDFARVLLEFSEAGYDIWWQVLDAKDFGIPQHRERVFVFGSFGEKRFRKIFFERKSSKTDNELQRQQVNTIRAQYYRNKANGSFIIERKFNEKTHQITKGRPQSGMIYGVDGIAPTLIRKTGSGYIPKIYLEHKGVQWSRVYNTNGIAPTLHRYTGGWQVIKIAVPVRQVDGRGRNANGRRFKTYNEPSFTLQSSQRNGVYLNGRIRSLTPLECERLMGWEDNWTKYGVDEKGNTVEISDTQRYNLIGNGVVPQIVRGIVEKVMKNE